MKSYTSFEDWGLVTESAPSVIEAYGGTQIVGWWGRIERQVVEKIERAEKDRNFDNANKLRQFLKNWRDHELTGSLNREDIDALKAAADMLAVDGWTYGNYFSNLRDSLRQLIAASEQLPPFGAEEEPEMPQGPNGGAPPQFGPEENAPPEGQDGEPKPPGNGQTGGPTDQPDSDLEKALNKATNTAS
jgi:hypothetical protein